MIGQFACKTITSRSSALSYFDHYTRQGCDLLGSVHLSVRDVDLPWSLKSAFSSSLSCGTHSLSLRALSGSEASCTHWQYVDLQQKECFRLKQHQIWFWQWVIPSPFVPGSTICETWGQLITDLGIWALYFIMFDEALCALFSQTSIDAYFENVKYNQVRRHWPVDSIVIKAARCPYQN